MQISERKSKEDIKQQNAYKKYIGIDVPDSMVCMVSDIVKFEAIDSVVVNGKTYWGCCEKCKSKLKYNVDNTLYSMDPITGNSLNKADAIIRLTRDIKSNKVAYFESYDSYLQFLKSNE